MILACLRGAYAEGRIVLMEDKAFGKRVYRLHQPTASVILPHMNSEPLALKQHASAARRASRQTASPGSSLSSNRAGRALAFCRHNGRREGGWEVFDFYTETKTVYVDYSGRLQKAQIDNVD